MWSRLLVKAALTALMIGLVPVKAGGGQPLIELRAGETVWQGRIVDRNPVYARLLDRSGRMVTVELSKVTAFRQVAAEFTPHTFTTLRTDLLKEFGPQFEVATSRHYLVLAPRGRAKLYVDVFEQTWRRFHMYFSIRGFEISDPEFPLIAIVLPDRKSFLEVAEREGAAVDPKVLGYYWQTHNRILMYESASASTADGHPARGDSERRRMVTLRAEPDHRRAAEDTASDAAWDWAFSSPGITGKAGLDVNLRETMIHEATHQLGYNLGLHRRGGDDPRWVVEGLATVFEAPGMESHSNDRSALARANRGWLIAFRRSMQNRPEGALAAFLRDDSAFTTNIEAAYAQAWALSFWLIETRPRQYAGFLRKTGSSERRMTPDVRMALFTEAFGDNLRRIEADMLRYFEKLDPGPRP